MPLPKVERARPILPNSSPEILKPISWENKGTFHVVWLDHIDSHALLFEHAGGTSLVATHNNGHSCHTLAERMIKGDVDSAIAQLEYIRDCGGTAISSGFVRYHMTGH